MGSVLTSVGWASPEWQILLTFIIALVLLLAGGWLMGHFSWLSFSTVKLDENIGDYWSYLTEQERDWSCGEQEYYMASYGIELINDQCFKQLRDTKQDPARHLQGVHTYDLLAN